MNGLSYLNLYCQIYFEYIAHYIANYFLYVESSKSKKGLEDYIFQNKIIYKLPP